MAVLAEFGFEKLAVWKVGMDLVESIYKVTRNFPRDEQFGLTSQVRRAATSIPSNIAEGYGRGSKASLANFMRIARGSLFEVRTQLEIARRIGIISPEELNPIADKAVELSRMLDGFIRSITTENQANE